MDTISEMGFQPHEILGLKAACQARLGQDGAARESLDRFLEVARAEMKAHVNDGADGWRHFWSNAYPFKAQADLEHLFDGLRRAGLPL